MRPANSWGEATNCKDACQTAPEEETTSGSRARNVGTRCWVCVGSRGFVVKRKLELPSGRAAQQANKRHQAQGTKVQTGTGTSTSAAASLHAVEVAACACWLEAAGWLGPFGMSGLSTLCLGCLIGGTFGQNLIQSMGPSALSQSSPSLFGSGYILISGPDNPPPPFLHRRPSRFHPILIPGFVNSSMLRINNNQRQTLIFQPSFAVYLLRLELSK